MTQWYYYNEKDEKQGPIRGKELVKYVEQGVITPETKIEDGEGHVALAKNVKGLTFSGVTDGITNKAAENRYERDEEREHTDTPRITVPPPVQQNPFTGAFPATANPFAASSPPSPFTQTFPTAPPPAGQVFCTNCGNPIAEQAAACMSCGVKPTGHKKFCRHCRAVLNPVQVVCTQCGAGINTSRLFTGNSNPLSHLNVRGMSSFGELKAGDFIILAASGMTLLSFFLPWISVTVPLVGTQTVSGFAQSICWLGALLFVYPFLIVLNKKRTIWSQLLGMFCGAMGILLGTIHIFVWSKIIVAWEIAKEIGNVVGKKPTLSDVLQDFSKFVSNDSCAGTGTFLFMAACIVLFVGIRMRYKNLD